MINGRGRCAFTTVRWIRQSEAGRRVYGPCTARRASGTRIPNGELVGLLRRLEPTAVPRSPHCALRGTAAISEEPQSPHDPEALSIQLILDNSAMNCWSVGNGRAHGKCRATRRLRNPAGVSRSLTLEDQTQLATLADARAVVVKQLTKRVDDAALTQVLKLLLIAARRRPSPTGRPRQISSKWC
jgi:hypothetical protein